MKEFTRHLAAKQIRICLRRKAEDQAFLKLNHCEKLRGQIYFSEGQRLERVTDKKANKLIPLPI